MYIFQYCCLLSHPLLPTLGPQICSLCLCLHCCPANRFISTIFLDSVYMYIWYLFFSFWFHSVGSAISLELAQMCSFLWLSNSPLYICTTTSLSIHLLMDMNLGCSHVLATVNSTVVNIEVHVSFSVMISSGNIPVVGLLGLMVVLVLVFCFFFPRIPILFSIVAVSVYIPTSRARGFPFLHTLSSIYCL